MLLSLWMPVADASAAGAYTYITDFAKTANDQTNLQWTFPVGLFVPTNALATPFDIVADANGRNFAEIAGAGARLVISNIGVSNVATAYSIMNAYRPVPGPLASVEFIGSGGADQVFILAGGVDIRDFYNGSWQNTINGTTAQNAYQINNVQGAAGTGNSGTGLFGTYRLDEQAYALSNAFLGQTLDSIVISNLNGSCTPFLVALTVQQPIAPSLTIEPTGSGGVNLLWPAAPGGWHLEQNPVLGSPDWSPNSNTVHLLNGINQVTVSPATNQLFFRLLAP